MPRIDFLIANAGHHAEAARPVAHELIRGGFECRLVSLCELRGLPSPADETESGGPVVQRLVTRRFRRSPSQAGGIPTPARKLRVFPQILFWHLYLARLVRRWLDSAPDLVTVPNDAAFPYGYICNQLRSRGIPFVVLQEGIRFTETVFEDSGIVGQGLSGATAIASWGETSAEFFRARGASPESIHLTGTPRFDQLQTTDWSTQAASLSKKLPHGTSTVAMLTNPIDLWGFCSRSAKMELLERFIDGLDELLEARGLRLIFKIHRQESLRDYRALVEGHRHANRMMVLPEAPLYPLLRLSDAAVILASTVGLEALLLGVPLGVLEIPGRGFIHDFVSSGAARGIRWTDSVKTQVTELLTDDPGGNRSLENYLDRTLSARGRATRAVAELIAGLTAPNDSSG
jgi:hypothetical protein